MYKKAKYLQRIDVNDNRTLKYQFDRYGDWLSQVSRNK